MDLPRLLFGVGFQNFYSDASNVCYAHVNIVECRWLVVVLCLCVCLCVCDSNSRTGPESWVEGW